MIEIPEHDPERTYTAEEERSLTDNLAQLTEAVHAGKTSSRPSDLGLVRDLHAALFEGVRSHAGRHRCSGRGTEVLTFGPHRSCHRDQVDAGLSRLFRRIQELSRRLDPADERYELEVIKLAVFAHAELIRIHPYEDGNGRVSRLLCTHLLVCHGLTPIPVETVKQAYTEALNHYFNTGELDPLADLYIGLAPPGR